MGKGIENGRRRETDKQPGREREREREREKGGDRGRERGISRSKNYLDNQPSIAGVYVLMSIE